MAAKLVVPQNVVNVIGLVSNALHCVDVKVNVLGMNKLTSLSIFNCKYVV